MVSLGSTSCCAILSESSSKRECNCPPPSPPRSPYADRLIARPHYAVLRVQSADLTTVERDVALIDPLAMKLLGLEEGDLAVIQGVPRGGSVPEVRLRAFSTPDAVRERREQYAGGDFTSRFPASSDALGVFPDLPWIFLDASERRQLGIGGSKLAVVRVRASRRFQMERELREILLVITLAIIGLATVINNHAVMLMLVSVLLAGACGIVLLRVRRRLEFTSLDRRD